MNLRYRNAPEFFFRYGYSGFRIAVPAE